MEAAGRGRRRGGGLKQSEELRQRDVKRPMMDEILGFCSSDSVLLESFLLMTRPAALQFIFTSQEFIYYVGNRPKSLCKWSRNDQIDWTVCWKLS